MHWNACNNFIKNNVQSERSFEEQQLAIKFYCKQIDKYATLGDETANTKNVGMCGFPGSGKT